MMIYLFIATLTAFSTLDNSLERESEIQTQELYSAPPGTLIFLGASETEIDTALLFLENGEYAQISTQNGATNFSLHSIDDLDLTCAPFHSVCKTTKDAPIDEDARVKLHLSTDLPPFLNVSFEGYFMNEELLPLVISPKARVQSLSDFKSFAEEHQEEWRALIHSEGALLLRGLPVDQAKDFAEIAQAVIGQHPIDYKGEGSRKRVAKGVYTSSEAPPQYKIPLHNELSCTINPVSYICFYCDIAPLKGTGQTLIARTEEITFEIMKRPSIWNLFHGKTLRYISNHPPEGNFFTFVNPTHKTWQQAFETTDKVEVEKICKEKGYDFKWNGDWIEVVRLVPATCEPDSHFDHPYWFNQAHLYHLNPQIRGGIVNHILASLLYIDPSTRQYDIKFEDGSSIPKKIIYEIYDILDASTIKFSWEKGDILLLDNRKALHGRAPFKGERRILTSMMQ